MSLQRLTRVGLLLLLCAVVGCSATGRHKQKKCSACEQGATYYYTDGAGPVSMPPGPGIPPVPGAAPMPMIAPQPLPDSQLQTVPPPPTGSAERPSPFQAMRERTGDFFRNANSNFRGMFSRDESVMR